MIHTDNMIQRTNKEWKLFIQGNYNTQNYANPPEHWFIDRFYNWMLARFNYGEDASGIDLDQALDVYKGKAYFWKNPILQTWEVVKPPEQVMLEFMKLEQ